MLFFINQLALYMNDRFKDGIHISDEIKNIVSLLFADGLVLLADTVITL